MPASGLHPRSRHLSRPGFGQGDNFYHLAPQSGATMAVSISKRQLITSGGLGIMFFSGCSVLTGGGANLTLTNSSGNTVTIAVEITDRVDHEVLLNDSYQVVPSDDGYFVEDVVASSGRYYVEATVDTTGESASTVWRIPSLANPEKYSIRVGFLSDGSVRIFGNGID